MTIYLDTTKEKNCVGVILEKGTQVVHTGVEVHIEPAKYRDMAKPFEENDFHFWFSDEQPEVSLYTVPKTVLGGYDSQGGYFAAIGEMDFREGAPLYYISADRRCWLVTDDCRRFRGDFKTWRENLTPSDDIAVFASREAAMEQYDIKELKDLWEEDL